MFYFKTNYYINFYYKRDSMLADFRQAFDKSPNLRGQLFSNVSAQAFIGLGYGCLFTANPFMTTALFAINRIAINALKIYIESKQEDEGKAAILKKLITPIINGAGNLLCFQLNLMGAPLMVFLNIINSYHVLSALSKLEFSIHVKNNR